MTNDEIKELRKRILHHISWDLASACGTTMHDLEQFYAGALLPDKVLQKLSMFILKGTTMKFGSAGLPCSGKVVSMQPPALFEKG